MDVCIYFAITKNVSNTDKKNGSVREYILKYLAKREAKSKKISLDGRWKG